MKIHSIESLHVEFIPKQLENGILYISDQFQTASHNCCCGCGKKVVTPIRETEYSLTESDGKVSLFPSIGNWNFPCQSHYWIKQNKVVWARRWKKWEIDRGREIDAKEQQMHFKHLAMERQTFSEKCRNLWNKIRERWIS